MIFLTKTFSFSKIDFIKIILAICNYIYSFYNNVLFIFVQVI